ncbi:MAG: hypothetical protein OEY94_08950 [Alphaproteobacteria bacterium]|nr:hypothetical protein [Alphaproteobacteria bacterium]
MISEIKKYFRKTPLGQALGESQPEQWKNFQEGEFAKAKNLSDFIGILMRSAFCVFLSLFFQSAAKQEDFWLTYHAFRLCSLLALIIFLKIHWHIIGIVTAYWLSDTAHWNSKVAKVTISILAMMLTGALGYGIYYFVFQFAKSIGNLP